MSVLRIVPNIAAARVGDANIFYGDALGMDIVMDHGWIVTFAGPGTHTAQLSIATQGGSGTAVPDLSIEVDNLDEVFTRMSEAGFPIEYGPVEEPWGVRRFYVRDPFGKLINILTHDK